MARGFLVTVSGPDRVGVGAELWAALDALGSRARVADVAQITIRGYLVLCAEVEASDDVDADEVRAAIATRRIEADGITASVAPSAPGEAGDGRRLLVTLLAPAIGAAQLRAVFSAFAARGATCERIVHLAAYPVDCYELVVLAPDQEALRADLTLVGPDAGLDLAVQRAGLHRRSKHLVVMDADSTLLQDEVIDLLAAAAGRAEEVAAITEAAMSGDLDFAEALAARVALLAGLEVGALDGVRASLRLAPGARTLLRTLARLGYVPAVVSGGFAEVLAPLLADLGVTRLAANHLEVEGGRLTGRVVGEVLDRKGKERALRRFADEAGVPLAQVVAVGDGANDIDMLAAAGLGVAYNAKPAVAAAADTALSVPYLDAVLYLLGISRDEIEADA